MWVRNWYETYTDWRLMSLDQWANHDLQQYENAVNELLQTTMLEF